MSSASYKVCPRCGESYSYIERKRIKGSKQEYFYAVHMHKEGGKWKKRRCYLGPKLYSRVAPLQGFQLHGLMVDHHSRLLEYLDGIISELEEAELDQEGMGRLRDLSLRLARLLERLDG